MVTAIAINWATESEASKTACREAQVTVFPSSTSEKENSCLASLGKHALKFLHCLPHIKIIWQPCKSYSLPHSNLAKLSSLLFRVIAHLLNRLFSQNKSSFLRSFALGVGPLDLDGPSHWWPPPLETLEEGVKIEICTPWLV